MHCLIVSAFLSLWYIQEWYCLPVDGVFPEVKCSESASKRASKCFQMLNHRSKPTYPGDKSQLLYSLLRQSRPLLPVGSFFPRKGKCKKVLDYTCPIPSSKLTNWIVTPSPREEVERAQESCPRGSAPTWKETAEVGRTVSQEPAHRFGVRVK